MVENPTTATRESFLRTFELIYSGCKDRGIDVAHLHSTVAESVLGENLSIRSHFIYFKMAHYAKGLTQVRLSFKSPSSISMEIHRGAEPETSWTYNKVEHLGDIKKIAAVPLLREVWILTKQDFLVRIGQKGSVTVINKS